MTTPYHFHSDFCLQLCSYQSGFIVLFPHYLSHRYKTYRYSVQLGTFDIAWTLFWVAFDFIVLFAWECNHVISSIAKLDGGLQRRTTATCLLLFQEHDWLIGRSNHITRKGIFRSFVQCTKEWFFQNKNQQHVQIALDKYVPLIHHYKSLAAVPTSAIVISPMICWRLVRVSGKTVELHHYYYHYHPRSNPVLYFPMLWGDHCDWLCVQMSWWGGGDSS